ncbi:MAG: hypothetical protein M3310_02315, partial [Actinomycetota bacterium]|nr:hypothetical protein [Actinomycetota bacterium]
MLRRVAVSVTLASALVLLASIAHAATVERARFAVTLTATLSKDWNVARTVEGECDEVTRYLGRWRLTLSSRRRSTVAATAPGGTRRVVRFSPAFVTSLAGTARQSGSTAITRRGAGCVASGARRDCAANRRGVRAARTSFASPRVGRLRFGRLQRASAIRSLAGSCGNEPAEVRAIRPDL